MLCSLRKYNQLIDFELETPSFHIAIDQLNEQRINRIKIEIRKTQTCLTTIVDMQESKNLKYIENTMNKALLLARTADGDKRRIVVTNYDYGNLPFVPDPRDQVQEEPVLLLKV